MYRCVGRITNSHFSHEIFLRVLPKAISFNTFQDFRFESIWALFCSREVLFLLSDVRDRACMTRIFGANSNYSALSILSDVIFSRIVLAASFSADPTFRVQCASRVYLRQLSDVFLDQVLHPSDST